MNQPGPNVTDFSDNNGQDEQIDQLGRNSDHHLGSQTAVHNGGSRAAWQSRSVALIRLAEKGQADTNAPAIYRAAPAT
jgi:hypothetical protein